MKRMKRNIAGILLAVTLALTVTACSSGGTAPVLTIAGKEVTLGETKGSVFPLTEFEMTLPGGGVLLEEMPAKSWLSGFMVLKKEDTQYAYVYVYNPERDSVPAASATICEITFHMHSEEAAYWAEDNVLVNGIDFSGMDVEAVKEAMSDYKLSTDENNYLFYKDGKYIYHFTFDGDGIVDEVDVQMTIDKSYN